MPESRSQSAVLNLRSPAVWVCCFGGAGLLKPMPGTWGSIAAALVALPVIMAVDAALVAPIMYLAAALTLLAGLLCYDKAVACFDSHDPGQIVIDEAAGLYLGMAVLPMQLWETQPLLALLLVTIAFRVIDIAKPWPVPLIEGLPGAWGVMLDDLLAGLVAALICIGVLA